MDIQPNPNVLIICSKPVTGTTMKDPLVQKLMESLFPVGYNPTYLSGKVGQKFPDNLPEWQKFSHVLFAGCNVLAWLFNITSIDAFNDDIIKLENVLDTNGMIIFVEKENFIKVLGNSNSTQIVPTTKIETLRYNGQISLTPTEITSKEIFCNEWNKHFLFMFTPDKKYGYYGIRPKIGGRNRKKRSTRSTRKHRHKKIRTSKNKHVSL